jgi:hypothetical protein
MAAEDNDGLEVTTRQIAAELAVQRQLIGIALAHSPNALAEARSIDLRRFRNEMEVDAMTDEFIRHAQAALEDVLLNADDSLALQRILARKA